MTIVVNEKFRDARNSYEIPPSSSIDKVLLIAPITDRRTNAHRPPSIFQGRAASVTHTLLNNS
jgi:hypothetical protein